MLGTLLARQFGVIEQIFFDVPDVPRHSDAIFPFSSSQSLCEALIETARAIGGPEIGANRYSHNDGSTRSIYVGSNRQKREADVFLYADGWKFNCSTTPTISAELPKSSVPFGGYLGACFAASAIFKSFFGIKPTVDIAFSTWNWQVGKWDALPAGSDVPHTIPTSYVVGLGAVGAAFCYSLGSWRNLGGSLVLIDPQTADDTSRNRLLSIPYDHSSILKVDAAAQIFDVSRWSIAKYPGEWLAYTSDGRRKVLPQLRKSEKEQRYEWILSCVDRNRHRRSIASCRPTNCFGGSTYETTSQLAYYSLRDDTPCLACHHPAVGVDADTLAEQLRALDHQQRLDWYKRYDCTTDQIAAVEEYLRNPSCGKAGKAALALLGIDGETDWAVGHVSVASGVLLASGFLRFTMGELDVHRWNEAYAWFGTDMVETAKSRYNPQCSYCSKLRLAHP